MRSPTGWPATVPFIRRPVYADAGLEGVAMPVRGTAQVAVYPPSPCPAVEIRRITLSSHPAVGQCGLFAARDLEPGTLVLCYHGRVMRRDDPASDSSDYVLGFGRERAIDAALEGVCVCVCVCAAFMPRRPRAGGG
jgi:nuclear pore complex protein Nup98-Nup96